LKYLMTVYLILLSRKRCCLNSETVFAWSDHRKWNIKKPKSRKCNNVTLSNQYVYKLVFHQKSITDPLIKMPTDKTTAFN